VKLSLPAALALLVAGCHGQALSEYTCTPPCPSGMNCSASGCVLDAPLDLASPPATDCDRACSGDTPHCNAQGRCVACLNDSDCATGQQCRALGTLALCVDACADDSGCTTGQRCCGGACTDPQVDPHNCGACGRACDEKALHGTPACAAAACATSACASGWTDCNGQPTDGCETNTLTDAAHCGACGTVCSGANATMACAGGCYLAGCAFGWADCNDSPTDGCEQNVASDVAHCGGCGNACPARPQASSQCFEGICLLESCADGWADCDGAVENGCEAAVGKDLMNCGVCGNVCDQDLACVNGSCTCKNCSVPHAQTACVTQQCIFVGCEPHWGDCNNDLGDGCETQTAFDAMNCGACGNACPPNQRCYSGKCAACNPTALVLGEGDYPGDPTLVDALDAAGITATLVANGITTYAGDPPASSFGAVILLAGTGLGYDMPMAGQQAILDAQALSTGVVMTDWMVQLVNEARMYQLLGPLLIVDHKSEVVDAITYTTLVAHPIWMGLPDSFTTPIHLASTGPHSPTNGATSIASATTAAGTGAGVVVLDGLHGRLVYTPVAFNDIYDAPGSDLLWSMDSNSTLLMTNMVQWAARCY
jgi:hypothetical protein